MQKQRSSPDLGLAILVGLAGVAIGLATFAASRLAALPAF